ncbi:uncharacterized protein LOC131425084 isoform X2 [Malaya genurostris]|uniref:uncharacterized protein LOC131425084 isoform X2 n=1 Tax=Malaya genurostris TaxID=325434 RepID=UPI0026F3FD9F|nr:uncharacterized protein LOC131425084 isoform X2 [Malaya genurostris]
MEQKILLPLAIWAIIGSNFYDNVTADKFEEFQEHTQEVIVNCVHDVAPRFGKKICDCGYLNEDYIAPKFEGSTTEIEIANCKSLRVRRDTFTGLFQLTLLTIINVENLVLEPHSLDFANNNPFALLKIYLTNTLIEEVPSHVIRGHIGEVTFTRCRVGTFRPYSITSISEQLESLKIVESFVNKIERHAFKRFDVNLLIIEGSEFVAPIQFQSLYEIDVLGRFVLSNSSLNYLLPGAFTMKNVTNFVITNSRFEQLSGDAFIMQIRNSVRMVENYFNRIDYAAFRD